MQDLNVRKYVFFIIITLAFAVLAGRFFYLQIYKWDQYYGRSEQNRIRQIPLHAPRGLIRDRHGEILVDNRSCYSVFVIPYELQHSDSTLEKLCQVLDKSPTLLKKQIQEKQIGVFLPVRIIKDVDYSVVVEIEERKLELPGVITSSEPRRIYPAGVTASQELGFIGEMTRAELTAYSKSDYRLGDTIGKKGLERQYEYELRGKPGVTFVEVDALGQEVGTVDGQGEQPPQAGKDLFLTIDAELQRTAEALFKDKRGGTVLIDCRDGGILSIVSKPDYDPHLFTGTISFNVWRTLVNDPGKPLYNRMVQSLYSPGSTFKLVLVAAALETGACTTRSHNTCVGFVRLGIRLFYCWKKQGHGSLDLIGAIKHSCNSYFYKLGLQVDIDTWADFARRFGFGQPTGIDLPEEAKGLVPDRSYLDSRYGKAGWTKGMNLNLAIGQGDLLVTPLQMAQFVMIIANDGHYYSPHFVQAIRNPQESHLSKIQMPVQRVEGISLSTFAVLKEGMYQVVNGEGGTGIACRMNDVLVAGKTGTAQNPHGDDHAWFIGFAPFYNPKVAICVFVENGGTGGGVAAPLARKLLEKYFELERIDQQRFTKLSLVERYN